MNIIDKNSTSMFDILSVFPQTVTMDEPQTVTMDETHKNILRRNKDALVRDLFVYKDFCEPLVQAGVFTVAIVDEIKVC